MTPADLSARLRELMAEATPGEWRFLQRVGYIVCNEQSVEVGHIGAFRDKELLPFNGDRWRADGNLIVELVNNASTIIRLLEAVDSVEGSLKEVMDWICNWSPAFADDDEWPEAEHRARQALATLRAVREGER